MRDAVRSRQGSPGSCICGPKGPERHHFVLTAHHIVCDGWSSSVLFSDLSQLYVADCVGLPPASVPRRPTATTWPQGKPRPCHGSGSR
jgi:hypothetical protein